MAFRFIMVLAVAVALLPFARGASAENLPPAVIAVLDYQALLRDSSAGKDIRRQIDDYRAVYQKEISGEEDRLKAMEQELKRQQTIVSPDVFEKKRAGFEREVIEMQRKAQDRSRQLDRSLNAAVGELQRAIIPIVQRMTKQVGFNVVVEKGQILFASRALDITEEVKKELDAALPRMKVPEPRE